jgi:putative transposase
VILGKKIRLYPTKEQEQKLWQSIGIARYIYNWTIARQEENYKNGGKFITNNELRKEITIMKQTEEYKWLNNVSNNVAKQAVKDACKAYQNFFKGLADKPKIKSRKRSKPSFYNDTEKLKVKENLVLIEKVGWVKTSEQIPIDIKYTNPRISFDGKYWYIAVGIEVEESLIELTGESIGIDLGIKELATVSNIDKPFKNINKTKEVKRLKKRLKRKQKQASRKYEKGKIPIGKEGENRYKFTKTKNIEKIEREIKLIYRRLSNIRLNHIHQTTNAIVKTKPSRIVVED